jgi:hypothetical protein
MLCCFEQCNYLDRQRSGLGGAGLYTGITRGKRLVVLAGQKKAIAIAGRKVSGRRRWSKLDGWLRLGAPSRPSNSSKAD